MSMGTCPTCGAQVDELEGPTRRDDHTSSIDAKASAGTVSVLMQANPCGHTVRAVYRDDQYAPLYEVELLEP